jgi:hypothetical protein
MKSKQEVLSELSALTERYRNRAGGAGSREEHAMQAEVSLSTIHYLRDGLTRDPLLSFPPRQELEKAVAVLGLEGRTKEYIDK